MKYLKRSRKPWLFLVLFGAAIVFGLLKNKSFLTNSVLVPTPTISPIPSPTLTPTPIQPSPTKPASVSIPARINWDRSRPLTWDDFRGSVPADHGAESAKSATEPFLNVKVQPACTQSGGQYNCTLSVIVFSVTAQFSTQDSWVDPIAKIDRLLDHEQGHFDITEIYTRKMRSLGILGKTESATGATQQEALAAADKRLESSVMGPLRAMRDEADRFQNQYDAETDHSQNASAQSVWRTKINQLLGN